MPRELRGLNDQLYEQSETGEWVEKRGLFGQPVYGDSTDPDKLYAARDNYGQQITSSGGTRLWDADDMPSSGSSGAEGALAFLTLLLLVWLASVLLGWLSQILAVLIQVYRDLFRRYPKAMLILHLLSGMILIGLLLTLAGLDPAVRIAGILLVPGIWGWLWLTFRLPLIFIPINAVLTGGVLWGIAQLTRALWSPYWLRFTSGLPLLGDLPLLLGLFPLVFVMWSAGALHWPKVFAPLNQVAIGAFLWFIFLHIWTDWIPLWNEFVAPVSLMPPVEWLILFAPFALWLWLKGQVRWPAIFLGFNLLVFGGLIGLMAFHTQASWIQVWQEWMSGLPFASVPILAITLSPVTLYGWSWISLRWTRVFVVPNLLLTGGILGFLLDRTRLFWTDAWQAVWGTTLPMVDPALFILFLPLLAWVWTLGRRRFRNAWGALGVLLWSVIFWWITERTRILWQSDWQSFAGVDGPDPTLFACTLLPFFWVWARLRTRWALWIDSLGMLTISVGIFWILGRLYPGSTFALRSTVAILPFTAWGWSNLLFRRPLLGCVLAVIPLLGVGLMILLAILAPSYFQALVLNFFNWLAGQGLPVPLANQMNLLWQILPYR